MQTIPSSPNCLGLVESRQRGDSFGKQQPLETTRIWMGNGFFILTSKCDHCEQAADTESMARAARGRGRRGWGNNGPRSQDMGTSGKRIGRRPLDETLREATKAYK